MPTTAHFKKNHNKKEGLPEAGDVSGKYNFLKHVYESGYKGNLLVEHEWGDDRVGDIKVALRALLSK